MIAEADSHAAASLEAKPRDGRKRSGWEDMHDVVDVSEHTHLVKKLAARFKVRTSADRDDLEGAGMIGLIQAGRMFDPASGFQFSTFAGHRIRGAMLDHLRREMCQTGYSRSSGRMIRHARISSLDALSSNADQDESALQVEDTRVDHDSECRDLVALLETVLSEREREIVQWTVLDEKPWRPLAEKFGLTESRIYQIRLEAFEKLKAHERRDRKAISNSNYADALPEHLEPRIAESITPIDPPKKPSAENRRSQWIVETEGRVPFEAWNRNPEAARGLARMKAEHGEPVPDLKAEPTPQPVKLGPREYGRLGGLAKAAKRRAQMQDPAAHARTQTDDLANPHRPTRMKSSDIDLVRSEMDRVEGFAFARKARPIAIHIDGMTIECDTPEQAAAFARAYRATA